MRLIPTRLQIERWGPLIVGGFSIILWWALEGKIAAYFAKELMAALLSAAAIAAGFLTTALSILLPLSSTDVGRRLRRSGYLPHLFDYLRKALYSCLLLAVICLVAFFYLKEGQPLADAAAYALVGSAAYVSGALVRVAEVLINLFELASEPEDKQG